MGGLELIHSSCCSRPSCSDEDLVHVAALQQLTSLSLRVCRKITDKGLEQVAKLRQLKTLSLRGCAKITDAGQLATHDSPSLFIFFFPFQNGARIVV